MKNIIIGIFAVIVVIGFLGMFWTPKKPKELIEKEKEDKGNKT